MTIDAILDTFYQASPLKPEENILFVEDENQFYLYEEAHYRPLQSNLYPLLYAELQSLKRAGAIPEKTSLSPSLIKNVSELLSWTAPNRTTHITSPLIAIPKENLLIDPLTLEITPASQKHHATIALPQTIASADLLQTAPPQRFLEFLNTSLPDPENQRFLQMMMGYLLTPTTKAHAAFFVYGPGRNGKGVLFEIIRAMIPSHLLAFNSLKDLTTNRFRLSSIVGKRLNILTEEESNFMQADTFKNIVSGEPLQAERKFEGSFSFTPQCKLLFSTNDIPTFSSLDPAMRHRLNILPFTQFIPPDKRDPNLAQTIITTELPQIYRWAFTGLQTLHNTYNYQFPKTPQMIELLNEYERNVSSTVAFCYDEGLTSTPNAVLHRQTLYDSYKEWAGNVGRKPVSLQRFLKELTDHFPDIEVPDAPVYDPISKGTFRAIKHLAYANK